MKTFTIEQARSAALAGGVVSANLKPLGSMFTLEFETRNGPALLIATVSKQVQRFDNRVKAFEIMRDLGVSDGRFSLEQWRPEERRIDRAVRPDKAALLKATHSGCWTETFAR